MAFTELEIREAETAVVTAANAEDMFRLGLMYSTEVTAGRAPQSSTLLLQGERPSPLHCYPLWLVVSARETEFPKSVAGERTPAAGVEV